MRCFVIHAPFDRRKRKTATQKHSLAPLLPLLLQAWRRRRLLRGWTCLWTSSSARVGAKRAAGVVARAADAASGVVGDAAAAAASARRATRTATAATAPLGGAAACLTASGPLSEEVAEGATAAAQPTTAAALTAVLTPGADADVGRAHRSRSARPARRPGPTSRRAPLTQNLVSLLVPCSSAFAHTLTSPTRAA